MVKKILITFLIALISKFSFSQAVVQRSAASNTVQDARWMAQFNAFLPRYADTTEANIQKGVDSCGAIIFVRSTNTVFFRQCTPKKWVELGSSSGGNKVDSVTFNSSIRVDTVKYWINGIGYVAGLIDKDCGLISPGVVTWDSLLVFSVSPAVYCIDGTRYTSPQSNVTLSAADGSNPRIDVIAANSSGAIVVVEGTPAANPVKPQVDPSTQLELTYVLVPAGATTPGGITSVTIYDENIEWTTSSQNVTVDYDNTADPYHLTKAGSTGAITSSSTLIFTNSSTINLSQYSSVSFFIKLKSTFSNNVKFDVYWGNSGNKITDAVTVSNGTYGFTRTNTSSYQQITIPISAFTFEGGTISDVLYIQTTGSNASGFYIDWVRLQGGIPGGGGGNYVTSVFRKTGTDSVFQVINNIPVFAFIDSSGGVNIYNSDGTQTDATRTYDAAEQDLIFDNIKYFFVKMGSEGEVTKVISLGDPGYADEGNIQLINDGFGNATFQLFSKDSTNDIQNTISSNSTDHRTDLIVQDNNTLARSILSQYVDSFSLRFNATGYGSNLGIKLTKDSLMFKNVPYTLSTTGKKVVLRDTATGLVENIDPALLFSTPTLQQVLTAGSTLTTNNTIVNGANTLTITNDGLTSNAGLSITSNSTAAASNTQKGLNVAMSGANATSSQTTYGIYVSNAHSGTSNQNYGIYSIISNDGSNSSAITGSASSGVGVSGISSSQSGVSGSSSTGSGVFGSSSGNYAGYFLRTSAANGSITESFRLANTAAGTPTTGFGQSFGMYLYTDNFNTRLANQLISKWTTVADATRTSQFDITGVNSATAETFANFQTGGIVRVNNLADTLATRAYARSVGGAGGWGLSGNSISYGNYIGTNNDFDLGLYTNGTQKANIDSLTSELRVGGYISGANGDGIVRIRGRSDNGSFIGSIYFQNKDGNYIQWFNDLNGSQFLYNNGVDTRLYVKRTTELVINENQADYDFRVESDNNANMLFVDASTDRVGIATAVPTARLHLPAGTATANTAPLKLTSGTNLTTPEDGSIEYNGTNLFFTPSSAARNNILMTASVNSVSPTSPDRTITVVINGTTYYIAAKTTND